MINKEEAIIKERKLAFERVFNSADGEAILYVLGHACIPELGEYDSDPYRMAFKEGQRNMLMRILSLTNIRMEELFKKYEERKMEESQWIQ
jgi:hypothetical protein